MSYTPVELRHVRVGRRPFGYHRASVEQILAEVADSFETVWRDRGELADKVELLEQQLDELKGREQVLTNTLVAAERAAEELREQAKRESELIVAEAHGEARSILRKSMSERERLFAETRRIEALLRSALDLVSELDASEPGPEASESVAEASEPVAMPEPARAPEPPPTQEETPEIRRVSVAPPPPPEAAAADELTEDPEPAMTTEPEAEVPLRVEEEQPGWPPLRQVARGSASFDWGD